MTPSNVDEKHLQELLSELKRRVVETEAALRSCQEGSEPEEREGRFLLDATIKFTGDFHLHQARGINISTGGICFETDEEIVFPLTIDYEDKSIQRLAALRWIRRLEDGTARMGFAFQQPLHPSQL